MLELQSIIQQSYFSTAGSPGQMQESTGHLGRVPVVGNSQRGILELQEIHDCLSSRWREKDISVATSPQPPKD